MNNPKHNEDLAWRKIGGEVVIIELEKERMFHQLNGMGTYIWELCDGKNSIQEIENKIVDEFEISAEEAHKDVLQFISQLQDLKVIQ